MPTVISPPQKLCTFNAKISTDRKDSYPSGLAIGTNILAVVDRHNAAIKMFDSSGNFLQTFSGHGKNSLQKPFDAVFLPNRRLVVTDPEAGAVKVFDCTGQYITDLEGNIRHPRGITLDLQRKEFIIVDGHLRKICVYDAEYCKLLRTILPISNKETSRSRNILVDPYYIDVTPSGNYAISDAVSPHIKIISPGNDKTGDVQDENLVLAQTIGTGSRADETLRPGGICCDRFGQILIADTINGRVHRALPNGRVVGTLALPCDGLSNPLTVGLDSNGHLLVAQAGGNISKFKYL